MFYQVQVVKDKNKLLEKIIDSNFDYKNIALVEEKMNFSSPKIGVNSIKIVKMMHFGKDFKSQLISLDCSW